MDNFIRVHLTVMEKGRNILWHPESIDSIEQKLAMRVGAGKGDV